MAVLYFAEEDARLWLRMQVACQAQAPVNNFQRKRLPATSVRATNVPARI